MVSKASVGLAERSDVDDIFAMDADKEVNGVTIQFGKLWLTIARVSGANKEFAKAAEEAFRPYRRMMEAGIELPEDVAKELGLGLYSTIVKDWNLAEGGVKVPCTAENVLAEFNRNIEMFHFVVAESKRAANYRKANAEADAKN